MNFPFPWWFLFPGVEDPPAFVIYSGIVVGLVGLVVAVGLWMLKAWSFRATLIVGVINLLLGAPGVVMGPTAALRATVLVTEVVAILIIVLVLVPSSQRALATADRPSRVR
jgi:uncharacterized membrane protein (DUF2068 family)